MKGKWYYPLVRVDQRDWHGCGIAAVATACGVSYERARHEFYPRRKFGTRMSLDDGLATSQAHMARVIRRLGYSVVSSPRLDLQRPGLMTFAWRPDIVDSGIHCVVWDPASKSFLDPSGPDHDLRRSTGYYLNKWRRSNFRVLVLTGKARSGGILQ